MEHFLEEERKRGAAETAVFSLLLLTHFHMLSPEPLFALIYYLITCDVLCSLLILNLNSNARQNNTLIKEVVRTCSRS